MLFHSYLLWDLYVPLLCNIRKQDFINILKFVLGIPIGYSLFKTPLVRSFIILHRNIVPVTLVAWLFLWRIHTVYQISIILTWDYNIVQANIIFCVSCISAYYFGTIPCKDVIFGRATVDVSSFHLQVKGSIYVVDLYGKFYQT